jgi:DegV family protein with EDD domain
MGRVAVVTDSTSYLPPELVAGQQVTVVPLQIAVGDMAGDEGVLLAADDVARILAERGAVVRTSRPAPERFRAAYDAAVAAEATGVVVVALSSRLSGTCESARLAAEGLDLDVRVVDSRSTAMGSGFAVLAAAGAAAAGQPCDEVENVAREMAASTRTLFCVDTLEYLRRGGRIGRARALLGTALHVKPILHIDDGEIALLDKVRTLSRARTRLVDLAVETAQDRPVDVAVHYLSTDGVPQQLVDALRGRLPALRTLIAAPLGPAIGAHVGPGASGVVIAPATQ